MKLLLFFRFFIIVILSIFSITSCRTPEFDKYGFIHDCGIYIEKMKLQPAVEDSLIHERAEWEVLTFPLHTALYFMNNRDLDTCGVLFHSVNSFTNSSFPNSPSTLLANHYFSYGVELSTTVESVLDYCLEYAKTSPYDVRLRIGLESWKYARKLNDTIATRSVFRIVEGLIHERKDISDKEAKIIVNWCKIGQKIAEKVLDPSSSEYGYLINQLATYSLQINDRNANLYADSLFRYQTRTLTEKHAGLESYFKGAVKARYQTALLQHDYDYCREILDFYDSRSSDCYDDVLSIKELLPEGAAKVDHISYLSSAFNVMLYNIRNNGNARTVLKNSPYFDEIAFQFEKARFLFLCGDREDYINYLNRGFVHGAKELFPSSSTRFVEDYFRPDFFYYPAVLSLMTMQYNNPSPTRVYDALLFIKGSSDLIPPTLYELIKKEAPNNVLSYIDSIRLFDIEAEDNTEHYYLEKTRAGLKEDLWTVLASWRDVRSALPYNSISIDFFVCPSFDPVGVDRYKAAVLRPTWDNPVIVDICSEKDLDSYYNLSLSELYNIIWKPIEEYLDGVSSIYYSPDGIINNINIKSLVTDNGEYLLDQFDIYEVSSTKQIINICNSSPVTSICLYGGLNYSADYHDLDSSYVSIPSGISFDRSICHGSFNYLPYTRDEVIRIKDLAGNTNITTTSYTGALGTEESFRSLSGLHLSVLHLATHGFYYSKNQANDLLNFDSSKGEDDPLSRCGLVLSCGQNVWSGEKVPEGCDDGILLGSEIMRMDLSNIDLIVLSACCTALGDISSEGVSGLRKAFKRAGAKTLIMTLSPVDDAATAYFMSAFYQALFNGVDRLTAFDDAISAMRTSSLYSDPKYWAPFIMLD